MAIIKIQDSGSQGGPWGWVPSLILGSVPGLGSGLSPQLGFTHFFDNSQTFWLWPKDHTIAAKGCSPPHELEKAPQMVAFFLLFIKGYNRKLRK